MTGARLPADYRGPDVEAEETPVDRIVVVTGGSRGIGRAAAARFAADGDDVVITGRDEERLAKAAGEIGARAQRCDATVAADVEALADTVGDRLDVLVNMAGENPDTYDPLPLDAPLEAVAQRWRTNLDPNLMTAVLTTQAFRPVLAEGGAVINVGSIGAELARGRTGRPRRRSRRGRSGCRRSSARAASP